MAYEEIEDPRSDSAVLIGRIVGTAGVLFALLFWGFAGYDLITQPIGERVVPWLLIAAGVGTWLGGRLGQFALSGR